MTKIAIYIKNIFSNICSYRSAGRFRSESFYVCNYLSLNSNLIHKLHRLTPQWRGTINTYYTAEQLPTFPH